MNLSVFYVPRFLCWLGRYMQIKNSCILMQLPWFSAWAVNEARTRDPQLGKLVLYQLSYYRISIECAITIQSLVDHRCKGKYNSCISNKSLTYFLSMYKKKGKNLPHTQVFHKQKIRPRSACMPMLLMIILGTSCRLRRRPAHICTRCFSH